MRVGAGALVAIALAVLFAAEGTNGQVGSSFDPDGNPILLVPGIAGSMIRFVDVYNGRKDDLLWARITYLSWWMKNAFFGQFNPENGEYVSYNQDKYQIYVPMTGSGLYAIDNLNPDIPFELAGYWTTFVNEFITSGYEPGKSMFGFPYDWRQSTRAPSTMKRMKSVIEEAYKKSGNKKVTIVAHSMGCLVAQSFLSVYNKWSEKYVKKFIALAPPFRGAAGKTAQALIPGYTFDIPEIIMDAETGQRLAGGLPSLHELMPDPERKWVKSDPHIEATVKDKEMRFEPKHFAELFRRVTKGSRCELNEEQNIDASFNDKAWKWAQETRRIWKTTPKPKGLNLYVAAACCQDTPDGLMIHQPVDDYTELLDNYYYDFIMEPKGDGTVTLESQTASYWHMSKFKKLHGEHKKIIEQTETFDVVYEWLAHEAGHRSLYEQVTTDMKITGRNLARHIRSAGDWFMTTVGLTQAPKPEQ